MSNLQMIHTDILCRIDAAKRLPIVFFPETMGGGTMRAWIDGREDTYPLEYYHMTRPLSSSDEQALARRYAIAMRTDVNGLRIRHRLPRTPRPRVSLEAIAPAVITNAPTLSPSARNALETVANQLAVRAPAIETQSGTIASATPTEVMKAIIQLGDEFNGKLNALLQALTPATNK